MAEQNLIFTCSKESEGNDYFFKRYANILDVEGVYITTGITIESGYWGTETKSKSKVCEDENEAKSFCLNYVMGSDD